jgi:hypothetical protein
MGGIRKVPFEVRRFLTGLRGTLHLLERLDLDDLALLRQRTFGKSDGVLLCYTESHLGSPSAKRRPSLPQEIDLGGD